MIKTRIIPTLLYKDYGLVKGVKFNSWRRVGSLLQAVKVYSMRQVDELVFLDITATEQNRGPDLDLIDDFSDECFMPLAVGGGISTVEHVRGAFIRGADKVVINTALFTNPSVVGDAAHVFGSQSIVASIDVRMMDGRYQCCSHSGKEIHDISPVELAKTAERLGAGEILLTSVDKDGTRSGYDLDLLKSVIESVSIPVIASGGAGSAQDILQAIQCNASAVAAASVFHFTQITPLEIKRFLKESGVSVRV